MLYIRFILFTILVFQYAFSSEDFSCPSSLSSEQDQQLTLEAAIGITLQQQLEIQISKLNIQAQKGVVQHAAGPFDPVFEGFASHTYMKHLQSVAPWFSAFGVKTNLNGYENIADLTARKKMRIGTRFIANAHVDQIKNFLLYPLKTNIGTISFQVQQPLLRDFWYGKDTTIEDAAKIELYAVYLDNFQTISQKVLETTTLYWEAIAAQRALEFNEEAERRLEKISEDIIKLIKEDQLAKVDIHQPEERLAAQRLRTIISRQTLYSALQNLKWAMGDIDVCKCDIETLRLSNHFPMVPLDGQKFQELICGLIESAFHLRFDIQAASVREEEAGILLKGAINESLPELNLFGGVKRSDFRQGHSATPFLGPLDMHHPETDWTIGMNFSIPLYNDAALGDVKFQRARYQQTMLHTQQLMQTTVKDLTEAWKNQFSLASELDQASERVRLNQKLISEERKKLEAGFSTLFVLLDFETRLTDSLVEHVEIHKEYLQNIAQLRFLTGTIFRPENCDQVSVIDVTTLPGL